MNSDPHQKHLFQFELAPVESITPWKNNQGGLSLSLYALTDGQFRIAVGNETLLRYTPEIIARWGGHYKDVDYQVACFARDTLVLVSAVVSPIPAFFENIVRNEALFPYLRKSTNSDFEDDYYKAFRWLGERSIYLSYLTDSPRIWFVRVGDEVWVQWDNADRKFEGIDVWTARRGTHAVSVETFLAECRGFSERLISAVESRIVSIETGSARAQIPLDTISLRKQFLEWKMEFEEYLSAKYQPDIDWEESENALRKIASREGITLPCR